MRIVDLRERALDTDVVRLLAVAQIHHHPNEALRRAPAIAAEYAHDQTSTLWGYVEGEHLLGLIGVQRVIEAEAVVRDLAVVQEGRRTGIGRRLIDYLRYELGYVSLEGGTLASALDFYLGCGFEIETDGTLPDGQVIYRFHWRRPG